MKLPPRWPGQRRADMDQERVKALADELADEDASTLRELARATHLDAERRVGAMRALRRRKGDALALVIVKQKEE